LGEAFIIQSEEVHLDPCLIYDHIL